MKLKKALYTAIAASALFTTVFSTVANTTTNDVTASAKAKAKTKAKAKYVTFTPVFFVESTGGHPTQYFKKAKAIKMKVPHNFTAVQYVTPFAPDRLQAQYRLYDVYYAQYKGKLVNVTKYTLGFRVSGKIDTKAFEGLGFKRISKKEFNKLNVHHAEKKYNKMVDDFTNQVQSSQNDDNSSDSSQSSSSQADSSSQASSTSSSN